MTAESSPLLDELRRQFESLGLQHKAEFLLEASFRTFVAGVEAAGTAFSRELDDFFATMEREIPDEPRVADEPAAAAPGAPKRKRPASPGAAEGASPPAADV